MTSFTEFSFSQSPIGTLVDHLLRIRKGAHEVRGKLTWGKSCLKIKKMIPIGQDLKRERELRGISLEEIADATKINIRFLRALEEDQFDVLPGKFFTRGIIREYAKYLGLEEESVLNKYHDALIILDQSEKQDKQALPPPSPMNIQNVVRLTAFGAAIIAVLIALFFIFKGEEAPAPIQPPPPEKIVQKKAMTPSTEPERAEKTQQDIPELNINILFQQDTWIQVTADGEQIYEGIKLPGGKLQVIAREELVIDVGNAGGLTYTLNSQKGKPFGPPGAVEKGIRITHNNLHEFIDNPDEKNNSNSIT